jgi:hypothetical protein
LVEQSVGGGSLVRGGGVLDKLRKNGTKAITSSLGTEFICIAAQRRAA